MRSAPHQYIIFFFFNDTATTEIYTLSLHDALPIWPEKIISRKALARLPVTRKSDLASLQKELPPLGDRKSTRLNSSHLVISYAVFCLKKKKNSFGTLPARWFPSCSLAPALAREPPC